jgi:hypothetical protein
MNDDIEDESAANFSRGFYDALSAGKSYDKAFEEGLSAVTLNVRHKRTQPIRITHSPLCSCCRGGGIAASGCPELTSQVFIETECLSASRPKIDAKIYFLCGDFCADFGKAPGLLQFLLPLCCLANEKQR